MSEMCSRCGGLIMEPNRAYGYAGKVCHCPPQHYTAVGWKCPSCGRGLSPTTAFCDCNAAALNPTAGVR